MNKKIIAVITMILILGAIALGLKYYQTQNKQQNNVPPPSATPNPTDNWPELSNTGYVLKYPSEAKAEARESESIISFMGPKQIESGRVQTEIFDGYAFRIGPVDDPEKDLELTANREHQNTISNCNYDDGQVTELTQITISGQNAFQYSATGCYIDYTETFVSHAGATYRISQSYVGEPDDQIKYKEITDQILTSLIFTN